MIADRQYTPNHGIMHFRSAALAKVFLAGGLAVLALTVALAFVGAFS